MADRLTRSRRSGRAVEARTSTVCPGSAGLLLAPFLVRVEESARRVSLRCYAHTSLAAENWLPVVHTYRTLCPSSGDAKAFRGVGGPARLCVPRARDCLIASPRP